MDRKWVGALIFVAIFVTSTSIVACYGLSAGIGDNGSKGSKSSEGSSSSISVVSTLDETAAEEISSVLAEGFYDDIGAIYETETDDGLTIKMLRYHAPGKSFNYGTQPVLLFSGLCCNMNQYLQHTTPLLEQYCDIQLPDELADWAEGDENIEDDPMLYYSLAYYLWKIGYDPWFANYRGTGMGETKSDDGDKRTTLDEFALYDVRASVRKVNEVTNLHPVIGGHSTGGLTSLMYLQGCQFRWDGHVRSYQNLVDERNDITEGPETVKGFIGLEPAWIPGMTKMLDNLLIWLLLETDLIINLRGLIETLLKSQIITNLMDMVIKLIAEDLGETLANLLFELLNMDTSNTNEEWLLYFAAYAADKLYFRTLTQYLDFIAQDKIRECFKNGLFNEMYISPPKASRWDSYYYYSDNVDKMSVPSIIFLATHENQFSDLVDADKVISGVIEEKTPNENDEYYIVEGAHIDVPGGLRAPVDVFTPIGAWLENIC